MEMLPGVVWQVVNVPSAKNFPGLHLCSIALGACTTQAFKQAMEDTMIHLESRVFLEPAVFVSSVCCRIWMGTSTSTTTWRIEIAGYVLH